jgi:arylsulfatase A-like enzyme
LLEAAGIAVPGTMTGVSFLKRLLGEPFEGRKYIFAERGPHGMATFNEKIKANTFDLSRCVRSSRYKLIYNCTPYQEYQPVDSVREASWQEILAAHAAGTLAVPFERAYFTRPRPVYELYDLERDPAEMGNRIDAPGMKAAADELKAALREKMIVDFDFLPLPR